MTPDIFTLYLTTSRNLFISDSKGTLINHNMLNGDDFKREDRKVKYYPNENKIRVESINRTGQNSQIPYKNKESETYHIERKSIIDTDSLKFMIKRRRASLDKSWEEYFNIGRILTPYTTKDLPVPKNIRKKVEKRMKLLTKNSPKTLADLLMG